MGDRRVARRQVVYTANGLSSDLCVIDATTLRVIGSLPVGQRPWGVVVSP
jgi:YVTN family beta-propeller protein